MRTHSNQQSKSSRKVALAALLFSSETEATCLEAYCEPHAAAGSQAFCLEERTAFEQENKQAPDAEGTFCSQQFFAECVSAVYRNSSSERRETEKEPVCVRSQVLLQHKGREAEAREKVEGKPEGKKLSMEMLNPLSNRRLHCCGNRPQQT